MEHLRLMWGKLGPKPNVRSHICPTSLTSHAGHWGQFQPKQKRHTGARGPAGWLCQQGQAVSTASVCVSEGQDSGGRARRPPLAEDAVSREWPGWAPGGDPPAHLRPLEAKRKRTAGFTQVKLDALRALSRKVPARSSCFWKALPALGRARRGQDRSRRQVRRSDATRVRMGSYHGQGA